MRKIKKHVRWIVAGVALLALAPLAARVFAQSSPSMIDRSSEAWSRGKVIGETPVKQRVALQPAPDGGVFLVWQNMEEQLEIARIGADGQVILSHALPVAAKDAHAPQLLAGAGGRLHLLWRAGKHPHSTVRYASLKTDGALASQPETISDSTIPALDAPWQVFDAAGRHHVIWADEAGIQWTMLNAEGTPSQATTLTSEGRFPAVQADDQGYLHLVWRWQKRVNVWLVYYAVLDPERGLVAPPVELAEIFLRPFYRLGGPSVALTPEMGYVFWQVRDHGYIYTHSEYAFFPLDSPQQNQVEALGSRRGRGGPGLCAAAQLSNASSGGGGNGGETHRQPPAGRQSVRRVLVVPKLVALALGHSRRKGQALDKTYFFCYNMRVTRSSG